MNNHSFKVVANCGPADPFSNPRDGCGVRIFGDVRVMFPLFGLPAKNVDALISHFCIVAWCAFFIVMAPSFLTFVLTLQIGFVRFSYPPASVPPSYSCSSCCSSCHPFDSLLLHILVLLPLLPLFLRLPMPFTATHPWHLAPGLLLGRPECNWQPISPTVGTPPRVPFGPPLMHMMVTQTAGPPKTPLGRPWCKWQPPRSWPPRAAFGPPQMQMTTLIPDSWVPRAPFGPSQK